MALGNHSPSDAAARVGLLVEYFPYILLFEWGRAVASGQPVGPLAPAGPTPDWGALASAVETSRNQYLAYRHVDWQGGPSSARLYAAGGLLATAIGRTNNVFTTGGAFVAKRVVRRLFRYEGENLIPGSVDAYDADYGALDPNSPGIWDHYRSLFQNFWQDTGTGPYVFMLAVIQSWALATYGVALPDPF
jgi:hypothetical protein